LIRGTLDRDVMLSVDGYAIHMLYASDALKMCHHAGLLCPSQLIDVRCRFVGRSTKAVDHG